MSNDPTAQRFGIVSKLIFSERENNVRLETGEALGLNGPVTLDAAQLRTLGRQAYMLARRLDARDPK